MKADSPSTINVLAENGIVTGYGNGIFEVRSRWDGEVLGSFPVSNTNIWTEVPGNVKMPDGTGSIFFTFKGDGNPDFGGFELTQTPG